MSLACRTKPVGAKLSYIWWSAYIESVKNTAKKLDHVLRLPARTLATNYLSNNRQIAKLLSYNAFGDFMVAWLGSYQINQGLLIE